jgi:hypothetical protein
VRALFTNVHSLRDRQRSNFSPSVDGNAPPGSHRRRSRFIKKKKVIIASTTTLVISLNLDGTSPLWRLQKDLEIRLDHREAAQSVQAVAQSEGSHGSKPRCAQSYFEHIPGNGIAIRLRKAFSSVVKHSDSRLLIELSAADSSGSFCAFSSRRPIFSRAKLSVERMIAKSSRFATFTCCRVPQTSV